MYLHMIASVELGNLLESEVVRIEEERKEHGKRVDIQPAVEPVLDIREANRKRKRRFLRCR